MDSIKAIRANVIGLGRQIRNTKPTKQCVTFIAILAMNGFFIASLCSFWEFIPTVRPQGATLHNSYIRFLETPVLDAESNA
jgi:hypothetical protein